MDSLILMWKHPETKKNYVVGVLSKLSKRYRFTYLKNEVNTAIQAGFDLLVGFPDFEKKYYSNKLFPLFERRIPPKSRKLFQDVIKKYEFDINSDVMWQFLKISQGRTGTDTFSLVQPLKIIDKKLNLEFSVAGWSFSGDKVLINEMIDTKNFKISLEKEPNNPKDEKAILVNISNFQQHFKLGYIPTPYNGPIFEILDKVPNLHYLSKLVHQLDFDENRPVVFISFDLTRHTKILQNLKKSPYVVTNN